MTVTSRAAVTVTVTSGDSQVGLEALSYFNAKTPTVRARYKTRRHTKGRDARQDSYDSYVVLQNCLWSQITPGLRLYLIPNASGAKLRLPLFVS